ncbi:succinylglutamate-semialdehyde dehydrogenase [Estrella lausannensis]|uniref:N-succinylglutamate 5-semialdehyde dehydrogenase n=1 Tax=Estrella lausannensis TaxID=483423 RepID=A0A0H5DPC6_9BACT|nr:succinylglutamate-semialdehyde dehydrogenase [Estrella lausannensis]CRX38391.1 N-succinylglutamate 5-semialdehyde dehydrogenase [Estrella lausannensis]
MKNDLNTLWIDGIWMQGDGPPLRTSSPVDGQSLYEKNEASAQQVASAARSAKAAFDNYRTTTLEERMRLIHLFKEALIANRETMASTISTETGKPLWEALQETDSMIDKVSISKSAFRKRCRVEESYQGTNPVRIHYKPVGALAVLGPFNFPGHLPNGHIIPALLAGNTVVFKPSEKTPLTGELYARLMQQAGFPPGVFNMVQGGKEAGKALATSSELDGLLFTGSRDTGKALSKLFGAFPEKLLALEMGGNNPLVIDEIEDLNFACYIAIQSAFISAGQRCSCARRLILIDSPFATKFLSQFIESTKRLQIGSPLSSPEPFMGPLISPDAMHHLFNTQEELLQRGAISLLRSGRVGDRGNFVSPGVIDCTGLQSIPDEEVFGPFLKVIRVKDFDQAVEEAEKTRYGLTASLVSSSRHRYEFFQKKVRAGIVNWNAPSTGASSKGPFGGLKDSGNHRASAFFAADYCSSPVASIETAEVKMPAKLPPGMAL